MVWLVAENRPSHVGSWLKLPRLGRCVYNPWTMRTERILPTILWFTVYVIVLVPPASAHIREINVFGGASFTNYAPLPRSVGSLTASPSAGLPGWNASLEVKPFRHIGIVADFSGFYGTETTGIGCTSLAFFTFPLGCGVAKQPIRFHTFLAGPQVSFRLGKFTPFAHGLIGGGYVTIASPNGQTSVSGASGIPGEGAFVASLGGGVDYQFIPRIALRVQADAVKTTFSSLPLISYVSARAGQVNLRASIGLVFHLL